MNDPIEPDARQRRAIARAIARNSYCTLATTSAAGQPLVAGVLYAPVDGAIYMTTLKTSAKYRNLSANDRVAICIPVRRIPFAPPFSLQLQGRAEILAVDHPEIAERHREGRLKKITSHGELEDPDSCMLRITPSGRVATYGIAVSLRELLRDPLHANRSWRIGSP